MPVIQGRPFKAGTASRLVKSSIWRHRQSYELTDDAYGVSRTRRVLADGDWRVALAQFEMPSCRPVGGQTDHRAHP